MVKYTKVNVRLSDSQLKKLKKIILKVVPVLLVAA